PPRAPPPLPERGPKAPLPPQIDGKPQLYDADEDENSGDQKARPAATVRSPVSLPAPAPAAAPPAPAAPAPFEPPARAAAKAAAHHPPSSAAPADLEASIIVAAEEETESTSQRRAARAEPSSPYSDPWLRLLLGMIVVLS